MKAENTVQPGDFAKLVCEHGVRIAALVDLLRALPMSDSEAPPEGDSTDSTDKARTLFAFLADEVDQLRVAADEVMEASHV